MLICLVKALSIVLVLPMFGNYDDNLFDSWPLARFLVLPLFRPRVYFEEPFSRYACSCCEGDGALITCEMFFRRVGLVSIMDTLEASDCGSAAAGWTRPNTLDFTGCLDKFLPL